MFDTKVTIDQWEQVLLDAEAVVAEARRRQVTALRELERASVAALDGSRDMTDWTIGRLDVNRDTARALLHTARRVTESAEVEDLADRLVAEGASFDRMAATVGLAATGADPHTIEASRGMDLTGVERITRRWTRLTRTEEHRRTVGRFLSFQETLDGTGMRIFGEGPAVEGRLIETAIQDAADRLPPAPEGEKGSQGARRWDGLTVLAHHHLDPDRCGGESGCDGHGLDSDRGMPLVTVFVDAAAAAGNGGETGVELALGPGIGPSTLEALLCDARVECLKITPEGLVEKVGMTARTVPRQTRRFIYRRDVECTVRGCDSRHRLQIHHKIPIARGGTNEPTNLLLLCWYHHHIVIHGRGFLIDPNSPPGAVDLFHPSRPHRRRGPP